MQPHSGPPWKEVLAILRVIRRWSPRQLGAAGRQEASDAARLLGEALTILRIVRRMNQTELGAASQVPRDSISAYERGRFMPRADVLRRLVEALGFSAPLLERTLTLVDAVE